MRSYAEASVSLLCRVGARWCALPLTHVVEIMRPLPLASVRGAPPYVLGLSTIRGESIPVVDLAALLGSAEPNPQRLVIVRAGPRRVALVAGEVAGVRRIPTASIRDLPPLLRDVESIAALGELDAELLFVLDATRWMPDAAESWSTGEEQGP